MEKLKVDKIIDLIDGQIAILKSISPELLKKDIPVWRDRTIRMLKDSINQDELKLFNNLNGDSWAQEKIILENFLNDLKNGIVDSPQFFLVSSEPLQEIKTAKPGVKKMTDAASNKVFVVHGHDSLAKTEVARTLEKLGLEAIILHEQANEGKTVIEKFERDASQVVAAVIIMTGDDIGYPKNKTEEQKPRARQNVILELGYFSGILGRANVCVLYKDDVEIPSDYLGVIYVLMDNEGSWKFKLAKELKQAGLKIDLNKLA